MKSETKTEKKPIKYKILKGSDIKTIHTISSIYSNNCINVYDKKGNCYLMKITELHNFNTEFNKLKFNIVKKIKHNYLEIK